MPITPIMPKPPTDGSLPPWQYWIDSWNYAWGQYQKTPGGSQSSTPVKGGDFPSLHIPDGSQLGSALGDDVLKAEKNFQDEITTLENDLLTQVKQGAIWAVLIIVLVIGIAGLVIPNGENETPIVVPA